jgi:hypothetical protein
MSNPLVHLHYWGKTDGDSKPNILRSPEQESKAKKYLKLK